MNVTALLTHIRDDEDYYATDLLSCWGYQGNCSFNQESSNQLAFMESKGIWSNKVDPTEASKTPPPGLGVTTSWPSGSFPGAFKKFPWM